ncbi:MAG: hypothetical protein HRF43_18750 [Phycisphaerae bacterium]
MSHIREGRNRRGNVRVSALAATGLLIAVSAGRADEIASQLRLMPDPPARLSLPAEAVQRVTAPILDTQAMLTGPLTFTRVGMNIVDNLISTAGWLIKLPDSHGAAGPDHLVAVVTGSIWWCRKTGQLQNVQPLGLDAEESLDFSFFAPLTPQTITFGPKVLYDQYNGRFLVVATDLTFVAGGYPADTSSILVAVSDDSDPNGTWHFHKIDTKLTISGQAHFAYDPAVAVGPDGVYITADFYRYSDDIFGGSRLYIIKKAEFYAGAPAVVTALDPSTAVGIPGQIRGLTPTHMFGTPQAGVGTFVLSADPRWYLGSPTNNLLFVFTVEDSVTAPTFNLDVFFFDTFDNTYYYLDAEQQGTATRILAGNRGIAGAVWRDNALWTVLSLRPQSGINAMQSTVNWLKINTTDLAELEAADFGEVDGENIAPGTHTSLPSIAVDSRGSMALGFCASGPGVFPGAYYTGRLATDPAGATDPPQPLAVGLDYYSRLAGAGISWWGDYSATVIDPESDTFWVYNARALPRTPIFEGDTEDGIWGTTWGSFTITTLPGDYDFDGDVDAADDDRFAACTTGPNILYDPDSLPAGCNLPPDPQGILPADFDRDRDVDQRDYAIQQRCRSGENVMGNPNCAG